MYTIDSIRYQRLNNVELQRVGGRLLLTLERDPHYKDSFDEFCAIIEANNELNRLWAAIALVAEAQKFLVAAAQPGAPRMVPNRLVDAAWHTLILDTRLYERLSEGIGVFIHHNPDPQTSGWDMPGALKTTVAWMTELGLGPNPNIWGAGTAEYCSDHEPEPNPSRPSHTRCSSCSTGG